MTTSLEKAIEAFKEWETKYTWPSPEAIEGPALEAVMAKVVDTLRQLVQDDRWAETITQAINDCESNAGLGGHYLAVSRLRSVQANDKLTDALAHVAHCKQWFANRSCA